MAAPAGVLARTGSPDDGERAAKLAAYVDRFPCYLTAPLTERLFCDEDVTDIQVPAVLTPRLAAS
jgi:hypothetical protein